MKNNMDYKLHILNQSGLLGENLALIEQVAPEVIERVGDMIPLPKIDVVVSPDKYSAVPGRATGGYTPTANTIYLYINYEFKDLNNSLEKELISTLTHELHHSARRLALGDTVTYGTVLDALVSEGLAEYFDYEMNGVIQSEAKVVSAEILEEFNDLVQKDFKESVFDNMHWVHGSKEKNIPFQFGYSYGFRLVKEHIKQTGLSASELVATPSEEFIS